MPASIGILIAMTMMVAILAVYRKVVARNEDDYLHLTDSDGQLVTNQLKTMRSLKRVDRLGVGLTVVTGIYAIMLLALYLYTGLIHPPTTM
jgi:hypothetical protein